MSTPAVSRFIVQVHIHESFSPQQLQRLEGDMIAEGFARSFVDKDGVQHDLRPHGFVIEGAYDADEVRARATAVAREQDSSFTVEVKVLRLLAPVTVSRPERQQLVELYDAAMSAERDLWDKVKGKGPGMPMHDAAAWDDWLRCVKATNSASRALRIAFSDDANTGRQRKHARRWLDFGRTSPPTTWPSTPAN